MTEFAMSAITVIEDYEPPKREGFGSGRKAQPNPFEPVVAQLNGTWSDELNRSRAAVEFTYDIGADDGLSDLRRIKIKISKAAKDIGRSPAFEVRPQRHKGGRKYEGVCRFYLIPRIERKRKGTSEDTQTEQS